MNYLVSEEDMERIPNQVKVMIEKMEYGEAFVFQQEQIESCNRSLEEAEARLKAFREGTPLQRDKLLMEAVAPPAGLSGGGRKRRKSKKKKSKKKKSKKKKTRTRRRR